MKRNLYLYTVINLVAAAKSIWTNRHRPQFETVTVLATIITVTFRCAGATGYVLLYSYLVNIVSVLHTEDCHKLKGQS